MDPINYKYAQAVIEVPIAVANSIIEVGEDALTFVQNLCNKIKATFVRNRTFGTKEIYRSAESVYYVVSDTGQDCYTGLAPYLINGDIDILAVWGTNQETWQWQLEDVIVTDVSITKLKECGVIVDVLDENENKTGERVTLSTPDMRYNVFEIPTEV